MSFEIEYKVCIDKFRVLAEINAKNYDYFGTFFSNVPVGEVKKLFDGELFITFDEYSFSLAEVPAA